MRLPKKILAPPIQRNLLTIFSIAKRETPHCVFDILEFNIDRLSFRKCVHVPKAQCIPIHNAAFDILQLMCVKHCVVVCCAIVQLLDRVFGNGVFGCGDGRRLAASGETAQFFFFCFGHCDGEI